MIIFYFAVPDFAAEPLTGEFDLLDCFDRMNLRFLKSALVEIGIYGIIQVKKQIERTVFMKILVVNDDSIHSPGIALLAKAAMELGEVTVVAPAHQCSAMSQKLTIQANLAVEKMEDFPVPVKAAYKVDGTPVDCVKVALHYILEEKPDYVFSGINDGYNVGFDIAYSGTLGACFEAVMNGVPAIAFSNTIFAPLHIAEEFLVPIAKELIEAGQGRGEVWNVNFPAVERGELKGILWDRAIAPMQFYSEYYAETRGPDGSITLKGQGTPLTAADEVPAGTDIEAVLQGYISVGKVKSAVL